MRTLTAKLIIAQDFKLCFIIVAELAAVIIPTKSEVTVFVYKPESISMKCIFVRF